MFLGLDDQIFTLAQLSEAARSFQLYLWFNLSLVVLFPFLLVVLSFILNRTTQFGVIARATCREAIRQPVFVMLLVIGLLVMVLNAMIPYFTMGDETTMYKDLGVATILICCCLLAIWTASMSIAEEIEGKTAMTLLSKPVNRRQFILGKYVGILQGVLWLLIPLFTLFIVLIYFKAGYDYREAGKGSVELFAWQTVDMGAFLIDYPWPETERILPILQILPGFVLIFLEVALLAAVSVAISTRLPMIVNLVTCIAIFIVSNLTPVILKSATSSGEESVVSVLVSLFAAVFAVILPQLEFFNMQTAISTDRMIPPDYLGYCALYTVCFCTMMMLLSFILFEDRDLA